MFSQRARCCNHDVAFRHLASPSSSTCSINFFLSVSFSKIDKLMSVVTIRRGHLMNSVFVNPDVY